MNIHQRIIHHKQAFENFNMEVPPFRMTCAEHKELISIFKVLSPKEKHESRIKMYYGVEIELVVIVEDYN